MTLEAPIQPAPVVNVVHVDALPSEKIAEGGNRPPTGKAAGGKSVEALTLDVGKAVQEEASDLVGSCPETEAGCAGSSLALDLTMRSLSASKRHQCLNRPIEPSTSSVATPRHSETLRQHQLQVKHLKKEVQSLRDVYSRQMAKVETRCERMLQEKEDERNAWWKEKKGEIRRMQAATVVMQTLYCSRKKRLALREERQKEAHALAEAELQRRVEALQLEVKGKQEAVERELAEKKFDFEMRFGSVLQERDALESRNAELEKDVAWWRGVAESALAKKDALEQKVEELKQEAVKAEKSEEIARKDTQIEALEMDLKLSRKQFREAKHQEAENIRKELMECVKFIGQIIPEEWRARGVATGIVDQLSQDFQQHVLRPEYTDKRPEYSEKRQTVPARAGTRSSVVLPSVTETGQDNEGMIAEAHSLAPLPSARRHRVTMPPVAVASTE